MACMYVEHFNLGKGTLDAILDITQRGEDIAQSTRELLDRVDQLPGLSYTCAEMTIPGYPDGVYRMFFRDLHEAVDLLLRKHGHELIDPIQVPEEDPNEPNVCSEMWQGTRYQELFWKFCAVAKATDILLPLIFFSGSYLQSLRVACLCNSLFVSCISCMCVWRGFFVSCLLHLLVVRASCLLFQTLHVQTKQPLRYSTQHLINPRLTRCS